MPHVRLGYLHCGQHRSCVLGFLDTVAGYDGRSVISVLAFGKVLQHPYGRYVIGTVYSGWALVGFHEVFHGLKSFNLAELCVDDVVRVDIKSMIVKSFKISFVAGLVIAVSHISDILMSKRYEVFNRCSGNLATVADDLIHLAVCRIPVDIHCAAIALAELLQGCAVAFSDDNKSVVVAIRFLAHPADYRIHVLIPASPVVGEDGPIPYLGQDASVLVDLTLYDMQQFCKEWVRRGRVHSGHEHIYIVGFLHSRAFSILELAGRLVWRVVELHSCVPDLIPEPCAELLSDLCIYSGKWFIEKQELWLGGKRSGKCDPLTLAS